MPLNFIALGAGFALVYLAMIATGRPAEGDWLRSAAKTAATIPLVTAGLATGAPGLIVIGLGLGAAGDWLLSRPGKAMFLAGMAAFALGHIAYALHFFAVLPPEPPVEPVWQLFAILVFAILWRSTEGWLIPHTKDLRWPVRGYAAVILVMGCIAFLLPAHPQTHGAAFIRLGVGLFILSDVLLALHVFLVRKPALRQALSLTLWPAYWGGQALILAGATLYATPFGP